MVNRELYYQQELAQQALFVLLAKLGIRAAKRIVQADLDMTYKYYVATVS